MRFAASSCEHQKLLNPQIELVVVLIYFTGSKKLLVSCYQVVNYELSPASYAVYLNHCNEALPTENIELEPAVDSSFPHETNLKAKKSQVFLIPPLRTRTFMIDLNFQKYSKRLQRKASCISTGFHSKFILHCSFMLLIRAFCFT